MFEISGIREGYPQLLDYVIKNGGEVFPRGKKTYELSPFHVKIKNPRDRIFFDHVRNMNVAFSIAEFLWIVTGREDVEMLEFYNRNMKNYSDDGIVMHGAYGKRLKDNYDQFRLVLNNLMNDRESRQAVMTIFDAERDLLFKTKDVPCTVCFQFFIRENKLNMVTYMRSNDIYYGFPNDIFNFTMIQEMFARELRVEVGEYDHIAGSFHLYDSELHIVEDNNIENGECIEEIFSKNRNFVEFSDLNVISEYESVIRLENDLDKKFDLVRSVEKDNIRDILVTLLNYDLLKRKDYRNVEKNLIIFDDCVYNCFMYRSLEKNAK